MKDLLDKGAVLQRDKETYAIAPHIPAGLVTSDQLRKLADVADKYNVSAIKITAAQRIALVGLKEDDIDSAWNDLGMKPGAAIGLCVRSIKTCPGTSFCKRGFRDSVSMGLKLDDRYHGMDLPNKLKIGVSGCPNSCADSHTRDIGLIGGPKGWILYLGGRGGVIPRLGDRIAMNIPDDKIFDVVERVIDIYAENGQGRERLGNYIDRIGLEEFKKVTIRNVVVKLLTVICIFLFVKEKNDVPIYSFIMVMGYVIGYIAIWIGIKRKIYFSKIQLSEVRKHLVPCIVMLIPVLALNIYRSMNKVMLGSMVGMAETGIFDNGEKFIYCLSGLITSLGTVMLPKMSYLVEKNDVQQIHKYISLSIKFIVIMTSAMAFGLMAISNSLVYVMFGIAFQKSAIVLFLSAPTLIFMGWSNVIRTQYIIPHKKDDIYIKSTLFSAIINMLINIMLINRFLSVGAVIGTLIAEFFVPFYQYLRLRKEINYRKHLVAVIPYVLIGIGMVLILKFVEQLMGISIITLIVQTVLGGIIFVTCSVIYIYKCDKELLHFIMSTLKIRKG